MSDRDRARANAIAWARRIITDESILFLDLETTGLGPDAEIVDVAVIDISGRVIIDQLVCPLRTIPPEAVKVHGVTERMVAKAPLFREFYPRLSAAIRGRVLCIFNGSYDVGIIRQVCAASGLPDPVGDWQCAMLAAADWFGEPNKRGDGFRWHKLGDACAAMGVVMDGAHRALADADACRRLVLAMASAEVALVQVGLPLDGTPLPRWRPRDWTE